MNPCTRRVQNHHIRISAVTGNKIAIQHIFHIPRKKLTVIDSIVLSIHPRILNRLRNILYSEYPCRSSSNKQCNGSRPCIKIIDSISRLDISKIAYNAIKTVGLLRICLIEGLRSNLEAKPLHLLINSIITAEIHHRKIPDSVIALIINHIIQRLYLRKCCPHRRKHFFNRGDLIFIHSRGGGHENHHNLTLIIGPDHKIPQESFLLPQIEERKRVRHCILPCKISNFIRRITLEETLAYIEHLIEGSANMKTKCKALRTRIYI